MRNWVGDALDFSFQVWVGGSVFTCKKKLKISDSTEGVDGSNIFLYGFYLQTVAIVQRFLSLIKEAGEKFAFGKIIKLMTTVAEALQVCFLLPFELCVHNYFIIGHLQDQIQFIYIFVESQCLQPMCISTMYRVVLSHECSHITGLWFHTV